MKKCPADSRGMVAAMWGTTKRRGFPMGVLRLSAAGFQRGIGETKGRVRAWRPGLRVTIKERREGEWRIRCVRVWGAVGMYPVFDLYVACTREQAAGVVERAEAWGGGRVRCVE